MVQGPKPTETIVGTVQRKSGSRIEVALRSGRSPLLIVREGKKELWLSLQQAAELASVLDHGLETSERRQRMVPR